MQTIKTVLNNIISKGFEAARYDARFGEVTRSNRPDLCDFQCNGALQAAKTYGKSPLQIASEVVDKVKEEKHHEIQLIEAVMPGFINIKLSPSFLADYLNQMGTLPKHGYEGAVHKKSVVIDYGGANVAKALHVGHLRSAVIGESLRRLYLYSGHKVVGDIHLGDWGLQMGYVIEMLKAAQPDLSYFDEKKTSDYPVEPPFDIAGLSELYTAANLRSKTDEAFKDAARLATAQLQEGRDGYKALWRHILAVSVTDLKKNYHALNVDFDLWLGESDSQEAIPVVISHLEKLGLLVESQGAKVVFVEEPTDKKPVPPCILVKGNGAALYGTTDLATIYQRVNKEDLDEILYVVDKRQALHFEQVFRVARKSDIVKEALALNFVGFGTMNGSDGKPFKTREGGVMSLSDLIELLRSTVKSKLMQTEQVYSEAEKNDISIKVGLAAMKFADLSNQPERDYVFDLNQFASFEGKTGPYIQYAGVRMHAILEKASGQGAQLTKILPANTETELEIHKLLASINEVILTATEEKAPHKLCEFAYELSRLFNRFYHETHILDESDLGKQGSWLSLISLTKTVLSVSLELLGIDALEHM